MNFVEITSNDTWFKKYPEKIAGVEYETTSRFFPIMVKGTKEDVLRVTGVKQKLTIDEILEDDLIAGQIERDDAELKKAGWSRKDIIDMANFVTKKELKVPVIRYKSDGNSITNVSKKIIAFENFKNFFISEKPFDYQSNEPVYEAIFKVSHNNKVAYFVEGTYKLELLKEKLTQQIIDNKVSEVISEINDTKTVRRISLITLEIAKTLDKNQNKLAEIRKNFIEKKEQEDNLKKQARDKELQEYQDKQNQSQQEELNKAEKNYINGLYVDGETIIDLAKRNNIKVHIRTIGAIRKNNVSFKIDSEGKSYSYNYHKIKGKPGYKLTDSDFLFELYHAINNNNKDKSKKIKLLKLKAKAIKIKLQLLTV